MSLQSHSHISFLTDFDNEAKGATLIYFLLYLGKSAFYPNFPFLSMQLLLDDAKEGLLF